MSAGLLGALAGVGPGVQSGLNAKEDRASSKSQRTIAEAEEGRNAERHQWGKDFAERYKLRGMLEDPQEYMQWKEFYSGAGPVARQPAPVAPQNQYALPTVNPIVNRMPGAQDGGAMEVPQQAQQPQQQALPQPQQQQALPQPQQQQQPAMPQTTRRERYNDWYNDTARYAILTGGLEGYKMFQDMENATSRRQVMGYALQAVDAMDRGNVGEAMRAGNAALEVTPFDTGMKFEAHNGNLYMVGKDGKRGDPLNADHLRAFTENHMKTPETYLDWKKQYEVERGALVSEKLGERKQDEVERGALVTERQEGERIGVAAKNAESTRRQADQYVAEGDSRELLRKAQAYAALAGGRAALMRAEDTGEEGGLAWTEENMLKIEEMEKTAIEGGLGFGGDWWGEQGKNSQLNSNAIGAAVETRIANPPNAMTHQDAATIARLAYFNDLVDKEGNQIMGNN
jgi:hypothetical protein